MVESLTETPQQSDTGSPEATTENMENIKMMPIEKIAIYGGTQARASTNDDAIDSYVESIQSGQLFPPVEIYFDGTKYWLADGFHRLLAYKRAGKTDVQSRIFKGSRKDALLHALGANSKNSLYRSNADKRNAVEIALDEFPEETNAFIAKICAVSPTMVSNARRRLDELNREDDEQPEGSKPQQAKTRQVSVPAGGIERQHRGSEDSPGGNEENGSSRSHQNKQPQREDFADSDLDDFSVNTLPETTAVSPFLYAESAIKLLNKIPQNDPDAKTAYARVMDWLKIHLNQ